MPDLPEVDEILDDFGAKLCGYDSMNELYHQDSGDLDDYHEMKYILNKLERYKPEAKSRINMLLIEARESKDNAYWERNQLVGVLSRLYPSHLARHPETDKEWEDDWRNIVCIHTPVGQATWHLHDSDMPMFKHLKLDKDHWDGHSTEEKYDRLSRLKASLKEGNSEVL